VTSSRAGRRLTIQMQLRQHYSDHLCPLPSKERARA